MLGSPRQFVNRTGQPIPVPQEVLEALTNVQVISGTDDKMNGFELTFVLGTRSPLHTIFLLSGGSPIPLIRVVIAVVITGRRKS